MYFNDLGNFKIATASSKVDPLFHPPLPSHLGFAPCFFFFLPLMVLWIYIIYLLVYFFIVILPMEIGSPLQNGGGWTWEQRWAVFLSHSPSGMRGSSGLELHSPNTSSQRCARDVTGPPSIFDNGWVLKLHQRTISTATKWFRISEFSRILRKLSNEIRSYGHSSSSNSKEN